MSDQQGPSSQSDPKRTVAPKKGPTRRFFHSIQPTFSIAQPSTRIEFLDNSDPSKDVIVRKKAREWVHRNKEREMATKRKQSKKSEKGEVEHVWEIEKGGARSRQIKMVSDPLMHLAGARPDPFDVLPAVGRKVDHIIEYFLTSCPEEIPCSDDKYAWRPRDLAVQPSRNNSILGTMSGEYVSFVLWLHATTLIRDGVAGNWDSEEMAYYYKLSLKVMQEASKRKVEQYTDEFICSLACFTACANFGGMFKASIVHNNAMMRAIALRGGGDLLTGFLKCKAWTRKAVQWCEFGVAAQNRALPKLPYQPPPLTDPLPDSEMADADRLTATTLSSIPPVSKTISDIFLLLHQLGVTQAHPPLKYHAVPRKKKMDPCVIRPLYDAEYTLLQVLSSQQTPDHAYTEIEVMLTEACQLYLWTGPRGLPPEMKMCDLYVVWLQKALLPLLKQARRVYTSGFTPPALLSEGSADTACSEQSFGSNYSAETIRSPSKLENAVLWGLYLGTVASRAHYRPEFEWYREHFRFQMQAAGLKTKDDLRRVLSLFPYIDESDWLGMHKLEFQFETEMTDKDD